MKWQKFGHKEMKVSFQPFDVVLFEKGIKCLAT